MKNKSLVQRLSDVTKQILAVAVALSLVTVERRALGASAAELLEKGIYTEETKGDLKAAINIYGQIVDDSNADANMVGQAQLRLGLCELKLGNKPQAISALERLRQQFPDKEKILAMVERKSPFAPSSAKSRPKRDSCDPTIWRSSARMRSVNSMKPSSKRLAELGRY